MRVLYDTNTVHPLDRYDYYRAGAADELAPVQVYGRAPGRLLARMSVGRLGQFDLEELTWAADATVATGRTERLIRIGGPERYRLVVAVSGEVHLEQADSRVRIRSGDIGPDRHHDHSVAPAPLAADRDRPRIAAPARPCGPAHRPGPAGRGRVVIGRARTLIRLTSVRLIGRPACRRVPAGRLGVRRRGTHTAMERGSSKHSARVDEEMKQEVLGTVQGIAGGRAEEWKMAEPAGEDQPDATRTVDDETANDLSRFGRYIGRSAMPGDRDALRRSAEALGAPDDILDDLGTLPDNVVFHTVTEVWAALGRGSAERLP